MNSTFGYDDNGQVVSIKHGSFIDRDIHRNVLGFKYLETIDAGLKPTAPDTHRSIKTHNDADQLTSEWVQQGTNEYTVAYGYSANGCMTSSVSSVSSADYEYDYDNRLTSAAGIEYIYDASGARVGRVSGATTNYFVIGHADGLKRPLAETDSNGTVIRFYVWAGMRLLCHVEANGDVFYYHSDELGSTLALTDSGGTVTDQFAYMPYGYANHTGSTETPFQWLGGYGVYYDSDTDLHLTLHRAYSSKLKRFIHPDPLGIDGGANVYAMANMNPLWFVDPYGLYAGVYYEKTTDVRITYSDGSVSKTPVHNLSELESLLNNTKPFAKIELEGHFGKIGEYEYINEQGSIKKEFIDVLLPYVSNNTVCYLDQCSTKSAAYLLSLELPGIVKGNDNEVRALPPFGPFADENFTSKDTTSYKNGIQK